jgi:uncharacterized protein YjbI with pentapeptide repeats
VGQNLTSASFAQATLTGADLSDAIVKGVRLDDTTSRGFTKEQLYSTASWKAKDLTGIRLDENGLSNWNLAGQNLTWAGFYLATLANADLSGANLTSADLRFSTLTGADLTSAIVEGTDFGSTTSKGFAKEQLYSTASWKAKNLTGIRLGHNILSDWNLAGQNLTSADFGYATLTATNLSGANLTSAYFEYATLTGAVLTDAIVTSADFAVTTSRGFTKELLYSTASWKAKELTGIHLDSNNLSGWNLAGQNLTCADLQYTTLTGADLTDAIIKGADLENTTPKGFTKEQLYSTASWKEKDLTGVRLGRNNLSGWNLAGQNLTSADLVGATMTGTDLTDAVVQGADFNSATMSGFAKEQLYSTASWKAKDLRGIDLGWDQLSGWNLAGQNLTSASFWHARMTGVDLTDAIVQGTNFASTTSSRGFAKEQLYSTASWKAKDLRGIGLYSDDLSGWNLAGQNLTAADFHDSILIGANLTSADLTSVTLTGTDLTLADLRKAKGASLASATTRNTIRPDGTVAGLNLLFDDTLVVRNCDLGIAVQTAMTLDPAALIEFRFDSAAWGSTVTPATGIVPDLGGTLRLEFADGVDPAALVGRTFDLFNWAGPLDAANRFDDVRSDAWAAWDVSNLYTTGEVTLLAVPEPATFALIALGGLALVRRRAA